MKQHAPRTYAPRVQIEVGEVSASGALTYIHDRALPASVRRCVHVEGPRRIAEGETADGSERPMERGKRDDEGRKKREKEKRTKEFRRKS